MATWSADLHVDSAATDTVNRGGARNRGVVLSAAVLGGGPVAVHRNCPSGGYAAMRPARCQADMAAATSVPEAVPRQRGLPTCMPTRCHARRAFQQRPPPGSRRPPLNNAHKHARRLFPTGRP
mmetsp:Transcript_26888/g.79814  ORF Transcript_26888/g.79814 Transcript_26888/m.79814 type:complete len:123 (-) Transcript_26888:417-785(-)|eukprot:24574-Chlamydomonas_euryale.AAC.1